VHCIGTARLIHGAQGENRTMGAPPPPPATLPSLGWTIVAKGLNPPPTLVGEH
jgi:hypothetical protein